MARRPGFHKVRSHIGIRGNECADKGAGQAARKPQSVDIVDESNNDPYANRTWVAHADPSAPTRPPDPTRRPADPFYV